MAKRIKSVKDYASRKVAFTAEYDDIVSPQGAERVAKMDAVKFYDDCLEGIVIGQTNIVMYMIEVRRDYIKRKRREGGAW